jgi:hypothetical protein
MKKQPFDAEDFARRIRVKIAEDGIDMKIAAKQIGCAHSTVSRVCAGISAPDVNNYLRIQKWLTQPKVGPRVSA